MTGCVWSGASYLQRKPMRDNFPIKLLSTSFTSYYLTVMLFWAVADEIPGIAATNGITVMTIDDFGRFIHTPAPYAMMNNGVVFKPRRTLVAQRSVRETPELPRGHNKSRIKCRPNTLPEISWNDRLCLEWCVLSITQTYGENTPLKLGISEH